MYIKWSRLSIESCWWSVILVFLLTCYLIICDRSNEHILGSLIPTPAVDLYACRRAFILKRAAGGCVYWGWLNSWTSTHKLTDISPYTHIHTHTHTYMQTHLRRLSVVAWPTTDREASTRTRLRRARHNRGEEINTFLIFPETVIWFLCVTLLWI